jgi:CHAT domain
MAVRRIDGSKVFVIEDGGSLEGIRGLGNQYDAVAYEYRGHWHLVPVSDLGELELDGEIAIAAEEVFGVRTRAKIVTAGVKPDRLAIVVTDDGDVSEAWLGKPAIKKTRKAPDKKTAKGLAKKAAKRRGQARARKPQTGGAGPLRGFGDGPPMLRGSAVGEGSPRRTVRCGGGGGSGSGGERATPPDAPETKAISRVPHLDAPDEIPKKPGAELPVCVYVNKEDLRAGETGEGIELDLPADIDSIEVGVLLGLTGPFELVEGKQYRELTITRGEDESAKLEFKLRIIPVKKPGPAVINALFTLNGRPCGHIARAWNWAATGKTAPAIDPDAKAPVSMPIHIGAEQPSLSIIIVAPDEGADYEVSVQAPVLKGYERPTDFKKFALPSDAANFREVLLGALTDESDTPEERFLALQRIGKEAWELAPRIVKKVLWEMVDKNVRPTTVYIASAEPILPWELMIPRRFDGKEPDELGPLGVEFAIGRWTRGDSQAPSPKLPVDRSFVIAPTYSEEDQLDFKDELKFVKSRLHGERVKPATAKDLNVRFADDQASLLHFICHGTVGKRNEEAVALDGGKPMGAAEMESRAGFKTLCKEKHPLVFLNACNAGKLTPSLAGGAGFPKSFGNIGASAIIAPLWPVEDKLASKIALTLYEEALKSDAKSIAEILRDIRRRGYEGENADTYAAYCFFGDPHARLELVP